MSRTVSILYTENRNGNHCAAVLGSTVLEDGVGVSSMNVRRTILLSNRIRLEYRSNKTILSFVCNLCAVEPVTLWPAAIVRSCGTRIVMFAIFRIVLTHMSQVNILNPLTL